MAGLLCSRAYSVALRQMVVLIGGVVLIGCAPNWHDSHKEFSDPYERGEYAAAGDAATRIAKDGAPTDKVLLNMEAGAILRTAGKIPESNAAFDAADLLVGDYNQWPTVKISEEAVAAVTTVRTINYRGTLSDLVMLNVYRALNNLEMSNPDGARTALIRAGFVQQDIATRYAKELHEAQEELDKKKKDPNGQYDAGKSLTAKNPNDPKGRSLQQQLNEDEYKNLQDLQPYADYINPFCDYMQGVFFYGAGLDASDRERAATSFKRTASMVKDNPYVLQDIDEAERVANGNTLNPATYVIFETGLAPELDQIQIPLPLFIFSNQAPTVVLFFPLIKPRAEFAQFLRIDCGGASYQTQTVSDMDAVLMQEFKNQLPTAITRMLIGAATKAAIDAAVKQGLKNQNDAAQIGFDIVSTVYQVAMNQADLRAWRSLPKRFEVARFPTPADKNLSISASDGTPPVTVKLMDGSKINVVYVRSVRAGLAPVVRQFVITPGASTPPSAASTSAPTSVTMVH